MSDETTRQLVTGGVVRRDGLREAVGEMRDRFSARAVAKGTHWSRCPRPDGGECSCKGPLREANEQTAADADLLSRLLDAVPDVPPTETTLGYRHTDPQEKCRECRRRPGHGQAAPHRVAPLRIRPPASGIPPAEAHVCDTGAFDRTLCPEPCGYMHSYCSTCGKRQDECANDPDVPPDPPAVDVEALARVLADLLVRWAIRPPTPIEAADALLSSGVLVAAADVRARAEEAVEAIPRQPNPSDAPNGTPDFQAGWAWGWFYAMKRVRSDLGLTAEQGYRLPSEVPDGAVSEREGDGT